MKSEIVVSISLTVEVEEEILVKINEFGNDPRDEKDAVAILVESAQN